MIRILQCCFLCKKTQARTVPWKRETTWLHLHRCNPVHSVICSLHFTFALQQETKQVLGCTGRSAATRPREGIPLPTHPAFPRSCLQHWLCLWAPQHNSTWRTKRDQDNQAGSALREGSKLEKSYWKLQVPICNMQKRQSWVLLRGQEQMQLHGKFSLCCWEVFTLCGESGFSKERYRTITRWNPRSPNPGTLHLTFTYTLAHTSDTKQIPPCWHRWKVPTPTEHPQQAGRSVPHHTAREFRSDALTCLDIGP